MAKEAKTRNRIIIGNWKMNPVSQKEAIKVFSSLADAVGKKTKTAKVICPPFVYLSELKKIAKGKSIILGAQDVYPEIYGAYTGEVSPFMLRDLGAQYVIVGHSERRAMGETDELINRKIKILLKEGLKAILCVGEADYDETGAYLEVIKGQLLSALAGVPRKQFENIIIAHEPVWAIGQNAKGADTPERFQHNSIFIRRLLTELTSKNIALAIPIIYGGSVTIKNAEMFLRAGEADGLLVGRESLLADNFAEIIKIADRL